MDFSLGEDRQMLADTLSRYLQDRYPIDVRHAVSRSEQGWSREHWQALADLGIVGALFGADVGGYGGTGFDIAAVFEQIGRSLVVEPFLGTLMAGQVLASTGQHGDLIAAVIAGMAPLALAFEEPGLRHAPGQAGTMAVSVNGTWQLTGTKSVVTQAEAAAHLVVSATIGDSGRIGLFLVSASASGLSLQGYPLMDGGRGAEAALTATPATLLVEDGAEILERVIAAGIVALSWEAVGLMDVIRTQTVEYLRTRKQFGVPIGKFQALQHRMATVALEIEQARSGAIAAADALSAERGLRERAISAAKHTIGHVGTLVAEEAIQLHGGIGMTWELPLSHYAKRLVMIGHQLGDEDYHLDRFIALAA